MLARSHLVHIPRLLPHLDSVPVRRGQLPRMPKARARRDAARLRRGCQGQPRRRRLQQWHRPLGRRRSYPPLYLLGLSAQESWFSSLWLALELAMLLVERWGDRRPFQPAWAVSTIRHLVVARPSDLRLEHCESSNGAPLAEASLLRHDKNTRHSDDNDGPTRQWRLRDVIGRDTHSGACCIGFLSALHLAEARKGRRLFF